MADTHGPWESGTWNNGIRETCIIIGNVTTSDFKQRGGEFVNMTWNLLVGGVGAIL